MAYNYHAASILIPVTVLAVACTVLGLIVYYKNKQKVVIFTMVAREHDRIKRRKKGDEENVFEEKAKKSINEVQLNIVDCEPNKNSYQESSKTDIGVLKNQFAEEQQNEDSKKTKLRRKIKKKVAKKGNVTKLAKLLSESGKTKSAEK